MLSLCPLLSLPQGVHAGRVPALLRGDAARCQKGRGGGGEAGGASLAEWFALPRPAGEAGVVSREVLAEPEPAGLFGAECQGHQCHTWRWHKAWPEHRAAVPANSLECSHPSLAGSGPGEAEGQARTVLGLASRLCVSPQALDEEYLKVDAQFGGVDQRKIFTFAEKVRNGGISVRLGSEGGLGHSQIHWEKCVGF